MTNKRWLRPALTLGVTLFLLSNAGSGGAQTPAAPPSDSTIDAQLFQPAIGPGNFVTIDAPDIAGHKQLSFGLALNYQWRPYVLYTKGTGTSTNIVEHQATAELNASIALFDRLQIGLALPFTPILQGQLFDTSGAPTGQNESARGLGDLRLEAKTQLAVFGDDDQYGVGLLAGVSVPTAKLGGASLDVPVGGSTPLLPGRQELHRSHQGDRRPADRAGCAPPSTWACCCASRRRASPPSSAARCSTAPPPPTRCASASS